MKEKIKKQLKVKNKQKGDKKWIFIITITAFVISFLLSLLSELIIPNTFLLVNILLVILFIFLGIIFDIVGVSITTADDKVFHSMASKGVKGAKKAITFIKNKEKVSSFCNDVIGDICGVISGSCGLTIAIKLSSVFNINTLWTTVCVTSLISAFTIGGKAIGKTIAVNNSNSVVFKFAKIISLFNKQ